MMKFQFRGLKVAFHSILGAPRVQLSLRAASKVRKKVVVEPQSSLQLAWMPRKSRLMATKLQLAALQLGS